MNNNTLKSLKKLTPLQLVVLILFAAFLLYQSMQQPPTPQPTQAAEVLPTDVISTQNNPLKPTAVQTRQPAPTAAPVGIYPPGDFDYLLLSLSWSPDYCATSGQDDPQQCSIGKKLGFVLHGLWPQNNQGYPSNCSNEQLPEDVKAQFPALYPSPKLYDHEWEKHGTCSGLSPQQYLALSKQLKEAVRIPDAFRAPEKPIRTTVEKLTQAFVSANPQLGANSLAVYCSGNGRYLKEVYVCFAKDGSATACSAEVRKSALKSCQSADFLVRNTR